MKTTVYALRNEKGTRVSYRYRTIKEIQEIKADMERHGSTNLEIYRTTQDLPRIRWR